MQSTTTKENRKFVDDKTFLYLYRINEIIANKILARKNIDTYIIHVYIVNIQGISRVWKKKIKEKRKKK